MNDTLLKGRRYINLVRCSTMEQADTSTTDQLRLLNGFAFEYGMIHAGNDVILDGVSGSVPGARDDIEQILRRKQEKNDFDVVLVQDVSRLTRGGPDHGSHIKWVLASAGIAVVFANEPVSDNPSLEPVMHSLKFWAAQEQAKSISASVSRGQMSSFKLGTIPHTFRVPYGIDRLYVGPDGAPRHRTRNLPDGTQQMLAADSETVLNHFPRNPKKGATAHYRRQSDEKIVLVPGHPEQVETVRLMYRRKLVDGKGSYAIAKELNDKGIPAADGGWWTDGSVEIVLGNTTYTGIGIAGQFATGLYNVRGSDAAPKELRCGIEEIANLRRAPKTRRPESEWQRQDHPLLVDYLGANLRGLAVEMHKAILAKRAAKALTPKSKSKPGGDRHVHSPYVLKGLLRTKDGNYPMTGCAKGPGKYRRRYYGATRGQSAPKTGATIKRLIPAEPLEQAVLSIIADVLLDTPNLKQRIEDHILQQLAAVADRRGNVELLRAEQSELSEKVRDAMNLGPSTRKLMQKDFDRWEARLTTLEAQIAEAEAGELTLTVDAAKVTANVLARLRNMADALATVPSATIRQLLASLVSKLTVDLETREVEMELVLMEGVSMAAKGDLGLVSMKSSTHGNEAQWLRGVKIADIHCDGTQRAQNKATCFTCRRKAA